MRFADIGYTILREDAVQESNWNDYSNYYKSVGREDKLADESLLAWPEKNEYEFGDSVVIGTVRQSDLSVSRIVYLGNFTYSKAGQLIGKDLSGQYYWGYGHDDSTYGTGAPRYHNGVVKSFSPRFYFDMLNYSQAEKEFEEYQSSDQVIHEFDDEGEHGLGREAFADPAVAKYFQEGWHLNPFGNDFIVASKKISAPKKFNKKSADKITNFNPSTDTLEIDTDSFGIDSSATFASSKNKKAVKKKLAKQDFDFLYDEKKGGLYFNANSSDKGFGDGGIIAILKGAPDLTSDNLEFI